MSHLEPTSRREFVQRIGLAAAGVACLSSSGMLHAANESAPMNPDGILESLRKGNERFSSGKTQLSPRLPTDFAQDVKGQAPPAIILGCADSRVPPEFVFDQPIGGLFVLRVAGNIVGSGPILLGSIEFAVAELGAKLIVVMGHSKCGACQAAIDHIENNDKLPGSIEGMVDYIRPVVREVQGTTGDKLVNVTKKNAIANAKRLETLGPILPGRVAKGELKIVGAYYEMSTGKVEFLG
ncbi:carbonic anhydrase [Planctomicrobium sp. SH527]|uniref:carbonic anhydrase n=1 Tax=Planctomicrobium sp. SH527 TaxID=3448123 RepID=UPI003F5B68A5